LSVEDIKAYIESGVLELYVLGDVSAEERAGVEAMALKYAEVRAELNEIEKSMQLYADTQGIQPAGELRNRVLNSLVTNLGDDRNFRSHTSAQENDNVVPMYKRNASAAIFYKYAFAASLFLLCISLVALVLLYKQLDNTHERLVALQTQNQQFSRQVTVKDDELAIFRDPSFQLIRLKGTPKSPASALTVAWSAKSNKVVIDMANVKLPKTDEAHQYQLWAIADGKPVDLGVFDAVADSAANLKPMKSIAEAQAFAVTVEPRGGSANPTMSEMTVIATL